MPAPRRYSRAQEDLVLALSARGLSSTEITAACAEGTETVPRFHIPDRSVRHLIQRAGRGQRSSDPRQQDPSDTDKPFMVRIAEAKLRDYRSGRLHFDSEEHLWKHMQGTIETAREYFDTDILEHHPEPSTCPGPSKPRQIPMLPKGPNPATTRQTLPEDPAPDGPQAQDGQPQARDQAESAGRAQDNSHAQEGSSVSGGNPDAGLTPDERQKLLDELDARLASSPERRLIIGQRRSEHPR